MFVQCHRILLSIFREEGFSKVYIKFAMFKLALAIICVGGATI